MDPYALTPKKPAAAPPQSQSQVASSPAEPSDIDRELLVSEISSSEGEVARWLSPYGSNPDPVARQKGLKLYEDMMADDQVAVCIGLRKKAILTTEWSIEPGDPKNPQSVKYAEFVEHVLQRMDGTFEDDLEDILSAIEFGFSVSELNYMQLEDGDWKGKWGLRSIKTREPYNYSFKVDGHGNILGLVYTGVTPAPTKDGKTSQQANGGLWTLPGAAASISTRDGRALGSFENPFPLEKFVVYSYNPKFNNPYGRSDLLAAFRYWNAKRYILKFWNVWLERYATPFMHATVDGAVVANKKKVMDDVDDFIKNLQSRSGFRSPKGVELNVLGGTNRTGGQSYEDAVEAFNRWMAHALFCPNLMGYAGSGAGGGGSSGGGTGSFALGKKQFESFMWILKKQTKDIEETVVGEQIINRLMDLNFPEEDKKLFPKFRMRDSDDEKTKMRAETLQILAGQGFVDPKEEWVREWLSLPEVDPNITLERPQIAGILTQGQLDAQRNGQDPNAPAKTKDGEEPKPSADEKPKEKKPAAQMRAKQFIDERPVYESKVDFTELAASLDSAEARFAATLNSAFISSRNEFMKTVRARGLDKEGADPTDVARLTFNVGLIKQALGDWMVKLHLDSKLRAFEELGKGGVPIEVTKKFDDTPNEAWEPIAPQDAVDFFNKKVIARIATSGGAKKLVLLGSEAELGFYDDKAFAVAGIVRDDILNDAKQIILNGIKRVDYPGMESDLKELFSKYIAEGEISAEVGAPARLATIVRTNTLDALNQGRKSLFEDPDVTGFVAYWEYSSVIDQRTTDYCRCMDKKLFAMDDIGMLTPPAHYNCRAITVPVTKFEVQGKELTISKPCPDRATSFADVKRDTAGLSRIMPGGGPPTKVPMAPEVKGDQVTTKSKATLEAERKLRDELSQMVVMCAYSTCRSREIRYVRRMLNIGEYRCDSCNLPFRVSNMGDLYLFDAGLEKWERASQGLVPAYFAEARDAFLAKKQG